MSDDPISFLYSIWEIGSSSQLKMRLRSKMPRIEPVRDRDGNITESRSMVIDISERRQAEEALEGRNRELSSLNVIATTISRSLELEKVLADTLRTVLYLMGLKAGWILLRKGQDDKLTLASHMGLPPEFLKVPPLFVQGFGVAHCYRPSGRGSH